MKIMKMEVLMFLETSFVLFRDVIYALVIGHHSYQMPMMCMTRNRCFIFLFYLVFLFVFPSVRNVAVRSAGFLLRELEVPALDLGPQVDHRELLPCFSSVSAGKCLFSITNPPHLILK